jgi:hypothetical protein
MYYYSRLDQHAISNQVGRAPERDQGCTDATLVSALNSEDAGTHNVANGLFSLPPDLVQAAFGQNPMIMNTTALAAIIPAVGTGSIVGSADCLAACKAGKTYSGP